MSSEEAEIQSEEEPYPQRRGSDSDFDKSASDGGAEDNDSDAFNQSKADPRRGKPNDDKKDKDEESDNPGRTPEERKEYSNMEKVFTEALRPRTRKRQSESEKEERKEQIEERIKQLMVSLAEANEKDQEDFRLHRPPFNRSRYVKTLANTVCDRKLAKSLINNYGIQFLELLTTWITPFRADQSVYPNVGLRLEVYKIVDKLPVNKDFLQRLVENRNTSSKSDIFQVLRATPTKRGSEEQIIIERILERWLRLIVTNPDIEASNETVTEDGLEALREAANYVQERDIREDKLEEKMSGKRKALAVMQPEEPAYPQRFVVAPKSSRSQRKKRH